MTPQQLAATERRAATLHLDRIPEQAVAAAVAQIARQARQRALTKPNGRPRRR